VAQGSPIGNLLKALKNMETADEEKRKTKAGGSSKKTGYSAGRLRVCN